MLTAQHEVLADVKERRLFNVESILKRLRGMVTVVDSSSGRRAKLSHFTMKEYLTSPRALREFSFSETEAHIHIAHQSLSYLMVVASAEVELGKFAKPPRNPTQFARQQQKRGKSTKPVSEAPLIDLIDQGAWISSLEKVPWSEWSAGLINCVKGAFDPQASTFSLIFQPWEELHDFYLSELPILKLCPFPWVAPRYLAQPAQRGRFLDLTQLHTNKGLGHSSICNCNFKKSRRPGSAPEPGSATVN